MLRHGLLCIIYCHATGYVYSGGCVTRTVGDEARQPSLLLTNNMVASGYCTGVLINTY